MGPNNDGWTNATSVAVYSGSSFVCNVGFEPTKPYGNGVTARTDSPASAVAHAGPPVPVDAGKASSTVYQTRYLVVKLQASL